MIYTITVAFCPAIQLARCLAGAYKNANRPINHTVVLGYYPINLQKNNRDIVMLCKDYGMEVLDPLKNLGSAQSQWWALQTIGADDGDYFINLDPDSRIDSSNVYHSMIRILDHDPDCVVISCRAPLIDKFVAERGYEPIEYKIDGYDCIRYKEAVPFNLSMFRYSFLKEIGGLPQVGEMWGELEGPIHYHATQQGKYHAYLKGVMEDESGKYMQDRPLLEFKDLNMRTTGPDRFVGHYIEYLRWKYPKLLETDTYIPDGTEFK